MTPRVVMIGTTNLCDERCVFCRTPMIRRPRGTMSMDVFRGIVEAEDAPIYDLCLAGEPMIDKHLVERVAYLRQRRPAAEIYFHTNGIKLTREKAVALAQAGLSRIVVSIYGFGPQSHTLYQPVGAWDRLVENVTFVATLMPTMVVGTHMPNEDEVRAFWEARGATVHFNELMDYGDGTKAPAVVSHVQRCTFALGQRTYDWDGTMVMCCLSQDGQTAFGKAPEEKWDDVAGRVKEPTEFCKSCGRLDELLRHFGAP